MYFIGSLIKSEREKHRVSQEELCFGICAVSTLSRIENNEQTPTMEKAVALLSRLGLEGSSYMSFISEEEYLFFVIRRDTEAILAHREYMRAYEYVMAQKEYLEKNKFRKQFLLAMDAIKQCYVDKKYETAIRTTEEALRITCPFFDKTKKIRYLLTDMEVNVINLMAVSYWWSGERITAINLLINLTDAIRELSGTSMEYEQRYPMVLCNLSKWLCSQMRYEEADEYIELGRRVCLRSGKLLMLPYFCCCKAAVLQYTNQNDRVLEEYLNAYIMFKNMNLSEDAASLRSFVLNEYNIDIEGIVLLRKC